MLKKSGICEETLDFFKDVIWTHYRKHGRKFSFRNTKDPYRILISEVMLQQTQAERVEKKFDEFIKEFPGFESLALAPVEEILKLWSGLGYNRRALALKTIAERVVADFQGTLPNSVKDLESFPYIGPNTAGSISAFAFNLPVVFIETNIRRVFIQFFFHEQGEVNDDDIRPLVEQTLDKDNPREWYFALIDYGVMLKKKYKNANKKSAHYRKQSKFKGSNRELRGKVLKHLLKAPASMEDIKNVSKSDGQKVKVVLAQLKKEGFIEKIGERYKLK